MQPVYKGCSHVEGYTEGSDHDIIRVFNAISFLLLDLIPQSNFAFVYKLNDVELVKFTYKYLILLFKEWLQAGEEVEHEVAVWLVFPGIETRLLIIGSSYMEEMKEIGQQTVKQIAR